MIKKRLKEKFIEEFNWIFFIVKFGRLYKVYCNKLLY